MLRRHVGVHWWYSVTYLRKNQFGNRLSLKESFRTSSRVSSLELFQVKKPRMRSLFLVLNFAVGYRLPQYEKTAYGQPLDYENEPGHGPHGRRHEHGHKYGTEIKTKMLKMNQTKANLEDKFWKLLEFTLIDMKKHDDNGSRKRKRSKNESPLNRAPRDGVSWNKMRNTLAKYRTYKAGNDAVDGMQAKSSDWKSSKIKRYSRKRHDRHEDITSVLCQLVEFYQENGTHKQKNLIRSFLEDNP